MKNTANLNLKKPDQTDYVNIGDLNDNMDVIDEVIQKKYEKPTAGIPKADLAESVQTSLSRVDELDKVDNTSDLDKPISNATQTSLDEIEDEVVAHKAYLETFKVATEAELSELISGKNLSLVKSDKDSEGIYTTVTYKRSDGTIYATSVLSGGTSPQYTTRTLTFYETDGTTVKTTKVYTLSYDDDGDLISEV